MKSLSSTLEQWQAFLALAETGSMTAAADRLNKSQSTVSYLVAQLQEGLGLPLVARDGRRSSLTAEGRVLLERARGLLEQGREIESLAAALSQGREAVVRLAVDTAFPADLLVQALRVFEESCQGTRLELHEAVMSGVNQLLIAGEVDVAVGLTPPPGYLADPLLQVEFVLVARVGHRLLALQRDLTARDLQQETQVVIRDTGPENLSRGWLSPTRRWSVNSAATAQRLIQAGLCFGRLPTHAVADDLAAGRLALLPMTAGGSYDATLYLSRAQGSAPGPAVTQLMDTLRQVAGSARRRR